MVAPFHELMQSLQTYEGLSKEKCVIVNKFAAREIWFLQKTEFFAPSRKDAKKTCWREECCQTPQSCLKTPILCVFAPLRDIKFFLAIIFSDIFLDNICIFAHIAKYATNDNEQR